MLAWRSGTDSFGAVPAAIPGQACDQLRHATPACHAGHDQSRADNCGKCKKQCVHTEAKDNLEYQQAANGNLYLAFQGDGVAAAPHWQAGLFPALGATLDNRQVGKAGQLQALCCLTRA